MKIFLKNNQQLHSILNVTKPKHLLCSQNLDPCGDYLSKVFSYPRWLFFSEFQKSHLQHVCQINVVCYSTFKLIT